MTHELNVPGITVWAEICSDGLIGPFLFDGNVKVQNYLEMLQQQFLPAAESLTTRRSSFALLVNCETVAG